MARAIWQHREIPQLRQWSARHYARATGSGQLAGHAPISTRISRTS